MADPAAELDKCQGKEIYIHMNELYAPVIEIFVSLSKFETVAAATETDASRGNIVSIFQTYIWDDVSIFLYQYLA